MSLGDCKINKKGELADDIKNNFISYFREIMKWENGSLFFEMEEKVRVQFKKFLSYQLNGGNKPLEIVKDRYKIDSVKTKILQNSCNRLGLYLRKRIESSKEPRRAT